MCKANLLYRMQAKPDKIKKKNKKKGKENKKNYRKEGSEPLIVHIHSDSYVCDNESYKSL